MNDLTSNIRDVFGKWMISAAILSSIGLVFYPSPCSSFLVSTDGRICPLVSQRQDQEKPSSIMCFSASSTEDGIEALERAKKQFERMTADPSDADDFEAEIREYARYPANTLKMELKNRGLPTKGRKPDLARRLAEFEYQQRTGIVPPSASYNIGSTEAPPVLSKLPTNDDKSKTVENVESGSSSHDEATKVQTIQQSTKAVTSFCGIKLSDAARDALTQAKFETPTPVQRDGIPLINQGESVLLHAETGSGKSLAYLLPITEHLWRQKRDGQLGISGSVGDWRGALDDDEYVDDDEMSYAFILTPTRELAAQVAGVASVLAPPGTVRLVSHPTDLASDQRYWKERQGESLDIGLAQDEDYHLGRTSPRIFVGSAKSIVDSLYGNKKMPASPTRKPAAQLMLKQTRWVVLDEVDRLLLGTGGGGSKKRTGRGAREHHHEKPAAILTSAVTRRTLGRAQIIAASATMGRPLKREISRVLGLGPKEWPTVVSGSKMNTPPDGPKAPSRDESQSGHVSRAITIPDTVKNYILPVDTSSVGKLLTNAFFVLKALNSKINDDASDTASSSRVLLVLTKSCGLSTANAVGALKHFGCRNPEPQSLLDVLQDAESTDQLMEVHRQVSKVSGIGVSVSDSSYFQDKNSKETNDGSSDDSASEGDSGDGYLLVTGEDSVRGLHLDGLDTVVVVGRAPGPDEYIHISGRTGRAGKRGKVINVLSDSQVVAVKGWEKMLDTDFEMLNDIEEISALESQDNID